ncbi:MAG: endopeptidase La [Clostridiales bacterium]|nr:endopeptidase La [Clostridiales bacterium]
MSEANITVEEGTVLPALALRGLTIFPNMLVHFDVGRQASMKALEQAMEQDNRVFLVAQKSVTVEQPGLNDLYRVGTICSVRQLLRMPDDNVRVMVEGSSRAMLLELVQERPCLTAAVQEVPAPSAESGTPRSEAVIRKAYELFAHYGELSERLSADLMLNVYNSRDPGYIADYIAQNIPLRGEDKQSILDEFRPVRRLEKMNQILARELQVLSVERDLEGKLREHMDQNQRDYYLREQLKVIQSELGEGGDTDDEIWEYRQKISKAHLPKEVEDKLNRELRRLEKQPFGSAEAAVSRNYLDLCLELPWTKRSRERLNVETARKILDADHYGMEKVKERILEFLAVKQLSPDLKGQILCLYGPPGVGKTSIATSVAKATNRKMARVSLGGIHDEAEIRGHRKTYIGAMPGRIITAISKAGTCNPLILLDEIDKLGTDQRSDPASALLEVLDGEQNSTFRDNFLELPFDLSDVLFITTANDLSTVPRPLLDRMELIELGSYTDEEKLQIARRHLLPKELKRHGLKASQLRITDDAIREIISGYTRESGVRLLERKLADLCRKAAMELVGGEVKRVNVNGDQMERYLGPRKYQPEKLERTPQVGLVNGLAWTSVGGELLEVEVNAVPGSGKVEPTGNLGKVMEESCHSAISYIRSRTQELGIDPDFYKNKDIHIHFPEAATPKDGPSAGIAITTAIVSALTGAKVKCGLAMTGEVTLRGRVLAIGGLREKTMAAYRNGIQTVIIPADNEKDLTEIDQTVRSALRFVTVEQVDQVLAEALDFSSAAVQPSLNTLYGGVQTSPLRPGAMPQ